MAEKSGARWTTKSLIKKTKKSFKRKKKPQRTPEEPVHPPPPSTTPIEASQKPEDQLPSVQPELESCDHGRNASIGPSSHAPLGRSISATGAERTPPTKAKVTRLAV